MKEFENLVVVITGGCSGIGLATAEHFHNLNSNVVVLDREISNCSEDFFAIRADVTSQESVSNAMAEIEMKFGRIDVLVNNAGISAVGTVEDFSSDSWSRVLDVNVLGVARVSAAALPLLRLSKTPAIVNLCSIAALNGLPQRAAYSASKGAVLSLTYAMATDFIAEGIRVNCVTPGTVQTDFVENMLQGFSDPDRERAALNARQATGRMVTPQEVAGAISYLASPLSGSTTGTSLEVDGGVTHLRVRTTTSLK